MAAQWPPVCAAAGPPAPFGSGARGARGPGGLVARWCVAGVLVLRRCRVVWVGWVDAVASGWQRLRSVPSEVSSGRQWRSPTGARSFYHSRACFRPHLLADWDHTVLRTYLYLARIGSPPLLPVPATRFAGCHPDGQTATPDPATGARRSPDMVDIYRWSFL